MERHRYNPSCPDCVPALLDVESGQVYSKDSPEMKQIMRVWNASTFTQREAYMNVTSHNSREPHDMLLAEQVMKKIEAALQLANRKVN